MFLSVYYVLRKFYSKVMLFLILILSCLATLPFFYIAYFVLEKGWTALSWDFFTQIPKGPGQSGGGLANAIMGSAVMVGMASLLGVPWGGALGIFLSEYRSHPLSKVLRFVVDLSLSAPSIVIGIFVYSLIVAFFGFSAYAGTMALLLIFVPMAGRTSEEILKMTPYHIREAGLALGLPRWRVILQILIPGAMTMLLSGMILSLARIAGETAPLLFTALGNPFFSKKLSDPIASLPVQIYEFSKSGFADLEAMAWGGALVLISFVFLVNLSARFVIFIMNPRYRSHL